MTFAILQLYGVNETAIMEKTKVFVVKKELKSKDCVGYYYNDGAFHNICVIRNYVKDFRYDNVDDVYSLADTLAHEVIHLLNNINKVEDVRKGTQYHTIEFKNTSAKYGLITAEKPTKKYGYSYTRLPHSMFADILKSKYL